MGSTCGCLVREAEEEVFPFTSDIALAKVFPSPCSESLEGQISVPVVNLEKRFAAVMSDLRSINAAVNVALGFSVG